MSNIISVRVDSITEIELLTCLYVYNSHSKVFFSVEKIEICVPYCRSMIDGMVDVLGTPLELFGRLLDYFGLLPVKLISAVYLFSNVEGV